MERKDLDKEIDFIARHYKEGLFNTEKVLRKIRPAIGKIRSWTRIAASAGIIIVLGATAALIVKNTYYSQQSDQIENINSAGSSKESISRVIDFDDVSLPFVIDQINLVYDVNVTNIPVDADKYRLSLHYEGNVVELIFTINEILGTNLEIEK